MIYFIQSNDSGPIKIGYTSGDPEHRLAALQSASPEPLKLLCYTHGTQKEEGKIHALFNVYRINGEWFEPVEVLLKYISTIHSTFGHEIKVRINRPQTTRKTPLSVARKEAIEQFEKIYLIDLLTKNNGIIKDCAIEAGIGTRQLHKLMSKCSIKKEYYRP